MKPIKLLSNLKDTSGNCNVHGNRRSTANIGAHVRQSSSPRELGLKSHSLLDIQSENARRICQSPSSRRKQPIRVQKAYAHRKSRLDRTAAKTSCCRRIFNKLLIYSIVIFMLLNYFIQ